MSKSDFEISREQKKFRKSLKRQAISNKSRALFEASKTSKVRRVVTNEDRQIKEGISELNKKRRMLKKQHEQGKISADKLTSELVRVRLEFVNK